MEQYLVCLFSYLLIIPVSVLCYLPVQEHLRYSEKKIYAVTAAVFVSTAPVFAYIDSKVRAGYNVIFILYCFMVYLIYRRMLYINTAKSLMVFLSAMVWMSYSANFTVLADRIIQPEGPVSDSIISSVIQLGISIAMTAMLSYPLRRYGSRIISELDDKRVWYLGCGISSIFIIINSFISPQKYETLLVNNVFLSFVFVLTMTFSLHTLLCFIFYYTTSGIIRSKKTEEEIKLYAMRESCYVKQQRYINENARVRHDFKHTIRTLKELADNGKYYELTSYINQFFEGLPENETISYCKNSAVNAVLNYYYHFAKQFNIKIKWQIDIPESTPVKDVDLCSIIGNILENAITASRDIPENERLIQLTAVTKHNTHLYIVATNNFNGIVRLKNDRYISTHRDGSGIGLSSIESIAESYGGAADFRHDEKSFYTNVVLTDKNNSVTC